MIAKAGVLASLTVLLPSVAFAHTGHDFHTHGLFAGLLHPVSGWDHLTGMLAVGFWSASLAKEQLRGVVTTFFAMLALGFIAGATGIATSVVESGIAASVLFAGLLLLRNRHLAMPAAAFFAAFFAVSRYRSRSRSDGGIAPVVCCRVYAVQWRIVRNGCTLSCSVCPPLYRAALHRGCRSSMCRCRNDGFLSCSVQHIEDLNSGCFCSLNCICSRVVNRYGATDRPQAYP